jgi:hypothetical protein
MGASPSHARFSAFPATCPALKPALAESVTLLQGCDNRPSRRNEMRMGWSCGVAGGYMGGGGVEFAVSPETMSAVETTA